MCGQLRYGNLQRRVSCGNQVPRQSEAADELDQIKDIHDKNGQWNLALAALTCHESPDIAPHGNPWNTES